MGVPLVPDWFGDPDQQNLFFGRMSLDGCPTQGPVPHGMREQEFDNAAVRVASVYCGVFDSSTPEQRCPDGPAGKTLTQVLTGIANGSFEKVQYAERWLRPAVRGQLPRRVVWIAWAEYYMRVPAERKLNYGGNGIAGDTFV